MPIRYVICIFINKQVDIYSLAKLQIVIGESPDSLSNALEDGPVLGIMNPGDVDGNGISDDGHAVIITDFDAENGTVYYWDPETGDMDNGSVGDFLGGWGINGTKE